MHVGTAASSKVWRRIGAVAREALLRGLSLVELRTIMMDIARARAAETQPADLVRRWREDRTVAPLPSDPRTELALRSRIWQLLPAEFVAITLSPLTPLGSASLLSGVGQNRVITTMRANELVSDPAHALALETSRRRRSGLARVHLAAASRTVAAWEHTPDMPVHELRFTLISSAPDGGGFTTEAELLGVHLDFWHEVMLALAPGGSIELVVWDATLAALLPQREGVTVTVGTSDRTPWRNPYGAAAFRLVAQVDGPVVLGDGGFVTWTQALTRNRKDRCLVSGISLDQLLALAPE